MSTDVQPKFYWRDKGEGERERGEPGQKNSLLKQDKQALHDWQTTNFILPNPTLPISSANQILVSLAWCSTSGCLVVDQFYTVRNIMLMPTLIKCTQTLHTTSSFPGQTNPEHCYAKACELKTKTENWGFFSTGTLLLTVEVEICCGFNKLQSTLQPPWIFSYCLILTNGSYHFITESTAHLQEDKLLDLHNEVTSVSLGKRWSHWHDRYGNPGE